MTLSEIRAKLLRREKSPRLSKKPVWITWYDQGSFMDEGVLSVKRFDQLVERCSDKDQRFRIYFDMQSAPVYDSALS